MTDPSPQDEIQFLTDQLKEHVRDNKEPVLYSTTVPLSPTLPPRGREFPFIPSPKGRGEGEGVAQDKPQSSVDKIGALFGFKSDAPTAPTSVPADKTPDLGALREFIGDCHLCPLGDTRKKLVFGVGNPSARVMLIGEGPGYSEDRQGEPFVGPAGQLLDKILGAMGLSRQKQAPEWKWVYIANIVKCHPMIDPEHPDNRGNDRAPAPAEIEKCLPFLKRQISLIKPDYILGLGAVAVKTLLNTSRGISSLHGQWSDFKIDGADATARFLPLYHPAALLRDENLKKIVWNAVKPLAQELQEKYA